MTNTTTTHQPAPVDFMPDADHDTREAAWHDRIKRLCGWTPYPVPAPRRFWSRSGAVR